MKLFLVHCGFYDSSLFDGTFKTHINFFVSAKDLGDARSRAMQNQDFRGRKMEIEGIHEIEAVNGCRIFLAEDRTLSGKTIIHSQAQRDRTMKGAALPQTTQSSDTAVLN